MSAKITVGINGFGRIGRCVLRALLTHYPHIQVGLINDLGHPETMAHLFRYDSVHGPWTQTPVSVNDSGLILGSQTIPVVGIKDPAAIPWSKHGVQMVLECTGLFTDGEKAKKHIEQPHGAKKVLMSAPGKNVDKTFVMGVNHTAYDPATHHIVSNGSCTTNCLAPVVQVLHQAFGIKKGLMTTVHSYTNDQVLTDVYHTDLRRARSATHSMIPTKTGAASAIGEVIPSLKGKLDGLAVRVPVINTSLVDFTFESKRESTVEEINEILQKAADTHLNGILAVNTLPLVSTDFNHHPASCVFDSTQTKVIGSTVKVLGWYDNEWGFSNRMLDNATAIVALDTVENAAPEASAHSDVDLAVAS